MGVLYSCSPSLFTITPETGIQFSCTSTFEIDRKWTNKKKTRPVRHHRERISESGWNGDHSYGLKIWSIEPFWGKIR